MIKVCYSEMDTVGGMNCRLEASGHAGYAPAGQDIVCAGASTLMQGLVYLLAGEENAHSEVWDEPDGPRLAICVDAPCEEWVRGAFEMAKAGFVLLAERYPDYVRFADISKRGKASMMELQLFAEGSEGAAAAPALSHAHAQQAMAEGTLKSQSAPEQQLNAVEEKPSVPEQKPMETSPAVQSPQKLPQMPLSTAARRTVQGLHAHWAAEEAQLRQSQPEFSLKAELKDPEMRRLMAMPGMRMQDAYRLAHYEENLRRTAQTVEQGVVERVQQRAARPTENGIRAGSAAAIRPDVAGMTRAQREALERRVMHGAQIEL